MKNYILKNAKVEAFQLFVDDMPGWFRDNPRVHRFNPADPSRGEPFARLMTASSTVDEPNVEAMLMKGLFIIRDSGSPHGFNYQSYAGFEGMYEKI